jgi:cytochrome c-type biogenesis protein CcmE
MSWEKSNQSAPDSGRWKFLVGGILILASVGYLLMANTWASARQSITVEELVADENYIGQTVSLTGAVIGDSIRYDSEELTIDFVISHIPEDYDNLAEALFISANDPNMAQIPVYIENEVKPDLLQHEAQAILTGSLGEDGVFYATELLLKCPSRFEDGGSRDNLEEDHPGMQLVNDAS